MMLLRVHFLRRCFDDPLAIRKDKIKGHLRHDLSPIKPLTITIILLAFEKLAFHIFHKILFRSEHFAPDPMLVMLALWGAYFNCLYMII